jgi:predicted ATPase
VSRAHRPHAETARLRSALAAAQDGAGGVMFLTGEAGIGKSRLASELAAEARVCGATVLAGRAVPTSASIPYRPVTEALLQALRECAFPDDPGLTPWLPALRAVIPTIGGPEGDGRGDHAAPVRGEAVLQLLRRFAGSAGLLLVLEDLHWADPDTLAVVEYLSDNLSAEAVLCVATCRGETPSAGAELVARVIARRAARHLALGRLTAGQVTAMVRACLPPAPDKVIARVQRAADGIPFLVEESLAAPACHGCSPMGSAHGWPRSVMTGAWYCIPPRCSGGSSTGGCCRPPPGWMPASSLARWNTVSERNCSPSRPMSSGSGTC